MGQRRETFFGFFSFFNFFCYVFLFATCFDLVAKLGSGVLDKTIDVDEAIAETDFSVGFATFYWWWWWWWRIFRGCWGLFRGFRQCWLANKFPIAIFVFDPVEFAWFRIVANRDRSITFVFCVLQKFFTSWYRSRFSPFLMCFFLRFSLFRLMRLGWSYGLRVVLRRVTTLLAIIILTCHQI